MSNIVKVVGITGFPSGLSAILNRFDRAWLKSTESGLVNAQTENHKTVMHVQNPNDEVDETSAKVISQHQRRGWNSEKALVKNHSVETEAKLIDGNGVILDTSRIKVNLTFQATKDWALNPGPMKALHDANTDLVFNDADGTQTRFENGAWIIHGLAADWPLPVTQPDLG